MREGYQVRLLEEVRGRGSTGYEGGVHGTLQRIYPFTAV